MNNNEEIKAGFFIQRPIFATVISIIITLVGLIAIQILPIERYPNLTPPQVSVSASYNGADAETIAGARPVAGQGGQHHTQEPAIAGTAGVAADGVYGEDTAGERDIDGAGE